MDTYFFRLPFHLSKNSNFPSSASLDSLIPTHLQKKVTAEIIGDPVAISDARDIAITGRGFESREAAEDAATQMYSRLVVTLRALGIGADFGDRRPMIQWSAEGSRLFASGTPFAADGLIVGLENPAAPAIVFGLSLEVSKGSSVEVFNKVMAFDTSSVTMDEKLATASILNGVAAFASDPEVRLTVLVMAIEALIDQGDRGSDASKLVGELISVTESSRNITGQEKDSILGSLRYLKKESINQAGI